jgi:hypothetical protein
VELPWDESLIFRQRFLGSGIQGKGTPLPMQSS